MAHPEELVQVSQKLQQQQQEQMMKIRRAVHL
ncbi:hypothetical protein [Kosakonia sp. S42]